MYGKATEAEKQSSGYRVLSRDGSTKNNGITFAVRFGFNKFENEQTYLGRDLGVNSRANVQFIQFH
jgi:hypothetical protein